MFEDNTCQYCNYPGDGKCDECHGTGLEQNIIEAVSEAIADLDQDCQKCGGSGECQTCNGNGYI